MVPRPKYSQPSFSSLKTFFFFFFGFSVSLNLKVETWKLCTNISQSKTLDPTSNLLIFLEVIGDAGLVFFFFFFLKSSFVAKLENRWETVWPFWFPSFLVEPQFYRFFRFFLSYFRFFIITKPICILVHSQTGWTGQSDPVFKTMIYIWVVCYYHNVLYKLNISLTMYL